MFSFQKDMGEKKQTMSERNSLRGAITFALWETWGMQLPESPWRMAGIIVKQLEAEGHVETQ